MLYLIFRYASNTHTNTFHEDMLHRALLDDPLSKSSEMLLDRLDVKQAYSDRSRRFLTAGLRPT